MFKEVGESEVIDVGVELEPPEVSKVEGLSRLEVSFLVDAVIEDYLQVGLDGLHEVRNICSRDIGFGDC